MLHIISFKFAQQETLQDVLQPYKPVSNFVRQELKNRQKEKNKRNNYNSDKGCRSCGGYLQRDQTGRKYCPSCNPSNQV